MPGLRRGIGTIVALTLIAVLAGCGPKRLPPPEPAGPAPPIPPRVKKATQRPYTINGQTYYPIPSAEGYREEGVASWYGRPFHGKKTASGEIYNMYALTAAHRILPLGTHVRVTNLQNGRSVRVRINDRGPFVRGRIIDLSFSAAKKIGLVGRGTAPVRVEAIGWAAAPGRKAPPEPFHLGPFTVQIGSFLDPNNAHRLAARLNRRYGPDSATVVVVDARGRTFHRVRVFSCATRSCAEDKLVLLERDGFGSGFVVAQD